MEIRVSIVFRILISFTSFQYLFFLVLRYFRRFNATIIDGKAIANRLLADLKTAVSAYKIQKRRTPSLTVLLIGDEPASKLYVRNKVNAAQSVGEIILYSIVELILKYFLVSLILYK